MYGTEWADSWPWMVAMMATMSLFGIGVLVLGWKAITQFSGGGRGSESPGEILKKRLARGEITSEEYHRLLEDVRS